MLGTILVTTLLVLVVSYVLFTIWDNIRGRRSEHRLERERGSQTVSDFASLFQTEAEQDAAKLLYRRLESLTFTKRLPLRAEDCLADDPLCIDPEDLYFEIEGLFTECDMCFTLNPEAADARTRVRTVGELVAGIAVFVEQQILPRKAY